MFFKDGSTDVCNATGIEENDSDIYVGLTNKVGNAFMIVISIIGICINVFYSGNYYKRIIKTKEKVSRIEYTLCWVASVEVLISFCWFLNRAIFYMGCSHIFDEF